MTKKMLIDATHAEETRVAIVENNRLEEFDYESMVRKQIKGGVYLAKVTRVEPSLQAAFVNYGGNRHGFLPFSEIHPDYFRIPVSDREALLEEHKAAFDRENDDEDEDEDDIIDDADENGDDDSDDAEEIAVKGNKKGKKTQKGKKAEVLDDDDEDDSDDDSDEDEAVVEVGGADKPADEDDADLLAEAKKKSRKSKKKTSKKDADNEDAADAQQAESPDDQPDDQEDDAEKAESSEGSDEKESDNKGNKKHHNRGRGRGRGRNQRGRGGNKRSALRNKNDELVDDEGGKSFKKSLRHKYKIQEVIKRGQVMLIQVSKEERGNKGAAVTSYLSLPGRYCVLMPNSPRGGGVSRKIGNFKDRKRMREILKELTIPDGMSVILRTAGVARTKAEIKRDLDYLVRLWNTIREDTLKSTAPSLINEEGNLIKRSIRDLYTRDIEEVLVSGEKGYKTAKEFMKMLVPSHAKKVKEYTEERLPLFHKYKVEEQISEIGNISVTLKSGGSLVINPTEALVSVDVNSGRATKERHIEETALKTNLEAASEVARQLRLRDLGGLVVIDFIDMEERRNNRKVENRLRDALSNDRARIQVGRISSFGLLELSRQRLNPSLTEAQFETCPHCEGSGSIKSLDFAAITALRAIVEEGIKGKAAEMNLNLPNSVAVYILNHKRQMMADIEALYEVRVHVRTDDALKPSEFDVKILKKRDGAPADDTMDETPSQNKNNGDDNKPKKSRRRGRRGGRRHNKGNQNQSDNNEVNSDQNSSQNKNDDQENSKESKSADQNLENKSEDKSKSKKDRPAKTEAKKSSKSAKKSSRKSNKKAPDTKSSAKPSASNDDKKRAAPKDDGHAKEFEVVNEAPQNKKKGWWNRLID